MAVDNLPWFFYQTLTEANINLLLAEEIGHDGIHLHTGGKGHGANRAMRQDVDIIDLGHIGDLLQLGDAARVRTVGLYIGYCLLLKKLFELPARQQPLARGDREEHVVGDLLERLHVFLRDRLFDEHRPHALELMANLNGQPRRHLTVKIKAQFYIVADPLAHHIGVFDEGIDARRWLVRTPSSRKPRLKGGIAFIHQHIEALPRSRKRLVCIAVDTPVRINANPIADRAAHQFIGRHIVVFTGNIPQRLIDA